MLLTYSHMPVAYKCTNVMCISVFNRFCVIDAPCGAGKTHFAKSIANQDLNRNIIAPTNRRAIAFKLSLDFNALCYAECQDKKDKLLWRRIAICLNSVPTIPSVLQDKYNIAIIDKAGAQRRHFATETMSVQWKEVMSTMRTILRNASTVLVMQHKLYVRDVQFWAHLAGVDLEGDRVYSVRFEFPTPRPCPMLWSYEQGKWHMPRAYC